MTEREREEGASASTWSAMGQYAGLGFQFVFAVGLFFWIGWKVDAWLGMTPLFTVLGAFVGAAAAFYSLYRHLVLDARRRDGSEKSGP